MLIHKNSLEFFIGAATRGSGENKWCAPGRDLPFLYRRKFQLHSECSIEPDLETWKKFGMVYCHVDGVGPAIMSINEMIKHLGEKEVINCLKSCPGIYLQESKHAELNKLGCPP